MSERKLERLLAPGEQVLLDGFARAAPPERSTVVGYVALLAVGWGMVLLGWLSVRGMSTSGWELGLGTITFRGSNAGGSANAVTTMPGPLAWLVLVVALELWRQAAARSTRLVVTPRRLIVLDGVARTRARSLRRAGGESVQGEGLALDVTGLPDGPLRLRGFDEGDREAVRRALLPFDPAPYPPPPAPLLTRRRVAAAVAAGVLLLVGWSAREARRPTRVEVEWGRDRRPGQDVVMVRTDRSRLVEEPFAGEVDLFVGGAPPGLVGMSGRSRGGLFRHERESGWSIAGGGSQVRVVVHLGAREVEVVLDEHGRRELLVEEE